MGAPRALRPGRARTRPTSSSCSSSWWPGAPTSRTCSSSATACPGLAAVLALRGGRALTLPEVVAESSLDEAQVAAIVRAAGLPIPGPEDRFFVEGFAGLGRGLAAAEDLFGSDAVLQLVRVMGAAMARVADAVVSAFLVNVEPHARQEEAVGLAIARANAQAVELIPSVVSLLEVLLRQHVIGARRSIVAEQVESGYEVQHLCVGFVDLVDSTSLAQTSTVRELGALLSDFEAWPPSACSMAAAGW